MLIASSTGLEKAAEGTILAGESLLFVSEFPCEVSGPVKLTFGRSVVDPEQTTYPEYQLVCYSWVEAKGKVDEAYRSASELPG